MQPGRNSRAHQRREERNSANTPEGETAMKTTYLICVAMALAGARAIAQPQIIRTEGLGQPLADSARIGDPDPAAPPDNLWVRAVASLPVDPRGYIVYQRGKQLATLDRGSFDPTLPFCAVASDSSEPRTDGTDSAITTGQQLRASVIAMQPNSLDLGPFHLTTDLMRIRVQRFDGAVVLGFMWPREAGSPAPLRRGALVGELREILGPTLEYGTGKIAVAEDGVKKADFTAEVSVINFEALVQNRETKRPITNMDISQFQVYEACAPADGASCKPVESLRMLSKKQRQGTVNFIVIPEIGGLLSHRATIKAAVGRLVDYTGPKDRAAIVPYHQHAVIWQPLTSNTQLYKRRANELFQADVGSGHVTFINTYHAVSMALNEVASLQPNERNVILLITEGRDCFNPYAIAKLAAEHSASIWVMDLTGNNQMELKPLAEMSGGIYFRVNSYDALMARIVEFVGIWNEVYFLSYESGIRNDDGPAPRREIRVADAGDVTLTVSKGFRGPQVVASMYNPEPSNGPSDPSKWFSKARSIEDLVRLIHQITSDPDFVGFTARAIGISKSVDEFLVFLEHADHIATPKRQKTIGHLIAANLDTFANKNPSADDWLKLRARVGHAEDWKRVTEYVLPKLQRAGEILQALEVQSIPETPGFTEDTNRALVGDMAYAHMRHFRDTRPHPPQIDAFVALLDRSRRIPAQLALGAQSFDRLAAEVRSAFYETKGQGESLALLEGLLLSATDPGQFWAIVRLYETTQADAGFVAGQAVLRCLKVLASFPSRETMIAESLRRARTTSDKLSVLRHLNGSLAQINDLKGEAEDETGLIGVYSLAISRAGSAGELIVALRGPSDPRFAAAGTVRDRMIAAELWHFGKLAATPDQYLALSGLTDTANLKKTILSAGLSKLADPAAQEQLKAVLAQIRVASATHAGAVK
jgi:hypothetical protein